MQNYRIALYKIWYDYKELQDNIYFKILKYFLIKIQITMFYIYDYMVSD
jgi:hypothetical protein